MNNTRYFDKISQFITLNNLNINEVFEKSWEGLKSKDEVGIIKEYLTSKHVGVDFLNNKLSNIKSDYFNIRIQSVFSHKQPRVTFIDKYNQPKGCELADILFIHRINYHAPDLPKSKNLYSSGFLCQVKLNHTENVNQNQECLYYEASEFKMPNWASEPDTKRRFVDKHKTLSFLYLKDKNGNYNKNKEIKKVNRGSEMVGFSNILIDFLKGDFGLKFDAEIKQGKYEVSRNGDWNILMNDLIEKVGKNKYPGESYEKLTEFLFCPNGNEHSFEMNNKGNDNQDLQSPSVIVIDFNFTRVLEIENIFKLLRNLLNRTNFKNKCSNF